MATRPRKRRTLPRRRWTNPLAWAVWNQRRLNKIRHDGGIVPPPECRYHYNFDGVDDVIEIDQRLIPDPINDTFEVGFSLEGGSIADGTFVAQNTSGTPASREFQIYKLGGVFTVIIGGQTKNTTTLVTEGKWRFVFGARLLIYKSDVLVEDFALNRGVEAEPDATFTIGARHASSSTYGFYYTGIICNVYVNNTNFYAIDDNSNTIVDSVSGQNGTLINGTPQQWEYSCIGSFTDEFSEEFF